MSRPVTSPPRTPWLELGLLFAGSRALVFQWDCGWFRSVARDGYFLHPGKASNIAFFPLYPMLMRWFGAVLGGPEAAGFLVSNAAFFGAIILLWKLVERDAAQSNGGVLPGDGDLAVRLLAFGPVSFFFSTVYSESTFLFLALACVYAGRCRRWWIAGLAGFAAALARNAGLLLCVPLLIELLAEPPRDEAAAPPRRWIHVAACLLPAMGIVVWSAHLWWRFGDPLLFLKVQRAWGRHLDWPWRSFNRQNLGFTPPFYNWWFVAHSATAVALLVAGFFARLRPSYLALAAAMVLLDFSATHLEAIPRLLSVIFPLYISGAVLLRGRPAAASLVLAASAALLAFSTLLFTNGYWFT